MIINLKHKAKIIEEKKSNPVPVPRHISDVLSQAN